MGDGYTSMFTGHFLWLSLGSIICPQTNKHLEFPKLKAIVKSLLTKAYKSSFYLIKYQQLIITILSYIKALNYLSTVGRIAVYIFFKYRFFLITVPVRVSHSLLYILRRKHHSVTAERHGYGAVAEIYYKVA